MNGDSKGVRDHADAVGANVAAAVATGIAGVSIEDSTVNGATPLFDFDLSVERIRAARRAIDHSGTGVILTARCETYLVGRPDLDEAIRRLTAYAAAGADCVYAREVGQARRHQMRSGAVAPKPVNGSSAADFQTVEEMRASACGAISVGGALARAAWAGPRKLHARIANQGTFTALAAPCLSRSSTNRFVERMGAFSRFVLVPATPVGLRREVRLVVDTLRTRSRLRLRRWYRAMLFHLGAFWYLSDAGILPEVDRISSVSGGSITCGLLGLRWNEVGFGKPGHPQRFQSLVVAPIRRMASTTIDVESVLRGMFLPGTISDRIAKNYDDVLFDKATLQDLPDAPRFVLNATNVQTGAVPREPYIADYRIGKVKNPRRPLAEAVTASSLSAGAVAGAALVRTRSGAHRGADCRTAYTRRFCHRRGVYATGDGSTQQLSTISLATPAERATEPTRTRIVQPGSLHGRSTLRSQSAALLRRDFKTKRARARCGVDRSGD